MSDRKQLPLTPYGRASFESVYVPTAMEEGKEKKYKVTLLFPKSMKGDQLELFKAMKASAQALAKEKFGVGLGERTKSGKVIKSPFRDGEEKAHLEGYGPDIVFVTFSGRTRPRVVDQRKEDILQETGDFYSGCWCRVTYTVYAYDKVNAGVAFGLVNVQKVKDDEAFSAGSSDPDRDFDEIDVAEVGAVDDDTPF